MNDLTQSAEWRRLTELAKKRPSMRAAFSADPGRARRFAIEAAGIYVDFSKNPIDDPILADLVALARAADLEGARNRMFTGEKVNETENRAVLHVALRDFAGRSYYVDGEDVAKTAWTERERLKAFTQKVHAGDVKGSSGAPLDAVVNIGIGGSDLGPQMAVEALRP